MQGLRLGIISVFIFGFISCFTAFAQPHISSISPTAGPVSPVGSPITITGAGFGASPDTVTVGGVAAVPSSWSDTRIVAPVPSTLLPGFSDVIVTVSGVASNAQSFLVIPTITAVSPATAAPIGGMVTVTGTSFGSAPGAVTFNGIPAMPSTWSNTSVTFSIPSGATSGDIVVTSNGWDTNGVNYLISPTITGLSPASGSTGTSLTINGTGFGTTWNFNPITIGGISVTPTTFSDTAIAISVPPNLPAGNADVVVTINTVASNTVTFLLTPSITSLSASSGAIGDSITITGTSFGATPGAITFNGLPAASSSWTDTSIVVPVPAGATSGPVLVTVNSASSNTINFNVNASAPVISSVDPVTGPAGTQINVAGSNFGVSQGASTLQLGALPLTIKTWSDTAITATVPQGSASGDILMTVGGQQSNSVPFTVIVTPVLTGHFSQTVTAVSLTSPLALDWEHWGTSNDEPLVRMAGVVPLLSDLSVIGSGSPVLFNDGEVEYLWTDGDVMTTAERTTTGVAINGTGSGFHLSVPADTIPKTLVLYTSAASAQAQLTASITDNSSAPYIDSSLNAGLGNDLSGTYRIDFRATQPDQILNIDYVLLTDNGNGADQIGKVTLQSAVLLPHLPEVSLSAPLDGQTFSAGTDINVAADASQIDYPVTKLEFLNGSQSLVDLLDAPYSFVISGATPGDHLLTAVAIDANGLTATSDPVLVTAVQSGGSLSASVDTPVDVDLSAGTTDWVHWGSADSPDNLDRKSGITPQISDLTTLANGDAFITDETGKGSVNYSWSGGTPTVSQAGTGTQVFMQGYKNGFSINMPADQTLRTAKLYLGYGYGTSTLRVSLSDGSAAPVVNTFSTTNLYEEKVVTIQFQAASPGQKLVITDQVTDDDGFAYVDLESATVSDQNSPVISTLSPVTGGPGTVLTISGSNFGDTAGTVTLNGSPLTVNSWSGTSITASLTGGFSSGPVIVTQGLANSNGVQFSYVGPTIAGLIPDAGGPGTLVSILGQNLGDSQTSVAVSFGGVDAPVINRTATEVQVAVPSTLNLGPAAVVLQVGGQPTNALLFDVVQPPVLTALTPNSGITGKPIRIFGSNFGALPADSTVFFGEVEASPTSWSETMIQVSVPPGFYGGVVTVIVGGHRSNGLPFVVPFRCFTDCNAQRSSISLSPQNLSVVVGEQIDLSVVDNLGETVPFPAFSVSDSTLATVSTSGNVSTLTALSPGTLTVNANVGSLTDSTTITIYPGPALPDGTIRWQVPASLIGVADQFIPAQPASGSDTATFVRDDTFPHSDVVIRALNQNGRELWAWPTGTDLNTLFSSPIVPTPNGGFVYTTQSSITSIDANGHPLWTYPYPQFRFEPLTVGYDGTVYALVDLVDDPQVFQINFFVTHLVALDPQTGTEKFRVPLPSGASFQEYSRPMMLTDGSINVAVYTGTNSVSTSPNSFTAIPQFNSHDPQVQPGNPVIYCPSEVLECWAPIDPSTGEQQTDQKDIISEQHIDLVNVQPNGSFQQFLVSQNQIDCVQYGTHYKYTLDDNFLLPGAHVSGTVHDSNGNPVGDTHQYQELREAWTTGICGVQPPGPNGLDIIVVPNGSGGVLVASETNDDQNPVWIKNVPQPSVSGDGTEIHLTTLDTVNNLVVGENGNAFAAGTWNFFENPRLVSFNLNSGAANWTYESPFGTPDEPGYVDIVAAGPNNSLYATEGDFFEQTPENAFTLDANGARTDNPTSSRAVTSVTSAGIGSNIWLGQNMTQLASLGGFDLGFGMPALMQSGVQLGVPGITAFASTMVEPSLSTYTAPSPRGVEGQDFPQLQSCKDDGVNPPCPREAIFNALKNLMAKLNVSSCSSAAQTSVFSKFKDANGVALNTTIFLSYLQRETPKFFDGTKSVWPYRNALCGPRNGFTGFVITEGSCKATAPGTGDTIAKEFASDDQPDAIAQTPSFPLLVFFRPSTIELDTDGANVTNEARVFHEALHGITGLDDNGLQGVLLGPSGVTVGGSSNVSDYIASKVLANCK